MENEALFRCLEKQGIVDYTGFNACECCKVNTLRETKDLPAEEDLRLITRTETSASIPDSHLSARTGMRLS